MWPFSRRDARLAGPRRFRYERFGGISQLERPRALVFVDRDRARSLGHLDSPLWKEREEGAWPPRLLSGPLEAHLQLTNRCTAGCQGCYTGATPEGAPREYGLQEWKRSIDALAARGVFHLALGGGESALLPWLGEVAAYARERGMVPNLTTSGLYEQAELQRLVSWAPLFGQINVSIDGVDELYAEVRGFHGFARADAAVLALRRVSPHVGLNAVVTRASFDGLARLFAYARRRRLREIELLRFKPSGRGAGAYQRLRCTDAQHRALLPTVLRLARRHRLRIRLDCSYTPMVAHHRVGPELMQWLAIYGCAGGDLLIGAKATGALTACSFAPPVEARLEELDAYWDRPEAFGAFRRWSEPEEPCRSCDYLSLCRGGCRVVSAHTLGDLRAPDPECPRVMDARASAGPPPPQPLAPAPPARTHLPVLS